MSYCRWECAPTIVTPLLRQLAQLRDAVRESVQVQDMLAVEALTGLDELKVVLPEFSDLHDMVAGVALELE